MYLESETHMSLLTYAMLYHSYKMPISKIVRIIFVVSIIGIILLLLSQRIMPRFPLFLLSVFLIGETLYHFKVMKIKPQITVQQNNGHDISSSFTLQAIDAFFFAPSSAGVIKALLQKSSVQFILHKANIQPSELQFFDVGKENIAKKAFDIVKALDGQFVTQMDIVVAYFLLTEQQTQLLLKKNLKPEELLHILYWARFEYPQEEHPPKLHVTFWGEGFADDWVSGWTTETKKYIVDITAQVIKERPSLLGRSQEFQELVSTLMKPAKNNALLIGDTGTGKTSLVHALALNSALGRLRGNLYHKRVYELMIGQLLAGVTGGGELETRLQTILQELTHAGNIILYISDVENIVGASTFHVDLSGALVPFLKDGKMPTIATVTPGACKQFIEPLPVFKDMFEQIRLEEPDTNESTQMLLEKANDIEETSHVTITFKAVLKAIELAQRFMQDRALPGSAVTLLTSIVAGKPQGSVIDAADIVTKIEEKTHGAIAAPKEQEASLLLNLESKLQERIIGQEEAVGAIAQAIRRLRSGVTTQTRPISFLFLGPTGVGKTETAKALSDVYFGGQNKAIVLDMSEYTGVDALNRLLGAAPGEGNEKGELTEKVYEHPFSLVLLDEFEKAHPDVLNLFLQVLEEGRLTDNKGRRISFANTIIIATSNGGALYIQDQLQQGKKLDSNFQQGLLQELEREHVFKPELLNRFDAIIVFGPLTPQDIEQITLLHLQQIQHDLQQEKDITVTFDQSVAKMVAQQSFDPQFGARPLRRFIQNTIEDVIARGLLEGKIQRGASMKIGVDKEGKIGLE